MFTLSAKKRVIKDSGNENPSMASEPLLHSSLRFQSTLNLRSTASNSLASDAIPVNRETSNVSVIKHIESCPYQTALARYNRQGNQSLQNKRIFSPQNLWSYVSYQERVKNLASPFSTSSNLVNLRGVGKSLEQ